jgi:hypothetical protein
MKKLAQRLVAALALLAVATPALPCEGMKNATASDKVSKPAVASASKSDGARAAPKAKGGATSKPASVQN